MARRVRIESWSVEQVQADSEARMIEEAIEIIPFVERVDEYNAVKRGGEKKVFTLNLGQWNKSKQTVSMFQDIGSLNLKSCVNMYLDPGDGTGPRDEACRGCIWIRCTEDVAYRHSFAETTTSKTAGMALNRTHPERATPVPKGPSKPHSGMGRAVDFRLREMKKLAWNQYRLLSNDIAKCSGKIKRIQAAVQNTVETEHQHKLAEDLKDTESILASVWSPPEQGTLMISTPRQYAFKSLPMLSSLSYITVQWIHILL
ncbi:hypothetical protein C8R44DRAFT_900005 [Mycena epipterygia]|nr:hypothetical protein C8R44DRAFT_900005 [Mycena epipterygia]